MPIEFISFLKWKGEIEAYSWSYFIDKNYQGMGYGKKVAKLAIKILKSENSEVNINISVEESNKEAQRLYSDIGFKKARGIRWL